MRILAIRGRNVASLAEPFCIDLTAEPLRSSGLFAITGETGSGKSSILDAMCLALYGLCPRLGAERGEEKLPDASGETVSAGDARSCLRRGASEGQAEVDFLGVDGVRYTATWTVRRSRGKSAGRLQDVTRDLRRMDDGQVIAAGRRDAGEAIERAIGLTYEEFRRTVLLAQGEFDAFLRADTGARAGLLEKVTGTSVYRDISRRVYERTIAAERAVTDIETRMGEHRVKSEEERAMIEAERADLLTQVEADAAQRAVAVADIARWDRLAEAQTRLADAHAALEASTSATAALAPQRERLAGIDRVEPLRSLHERTLSLRTSVSLAQTALGTARDRAAEASTIAQAAVGDLGEAVGALEEIEERIAAFAPVWTQATQLDTAIAAARSEAVAARSRCDGAEAAVAAAASKVEALNARRAAVVAARQAAEQETQRLSPFASLAQRWDDIAPRIRKRAEFLIEGRLADAEYTRQSEAAERHRLATATLDAEIGEARHRRETLVRQIAEKDSALAAAGPDGLVGRASGLAALAAHLRDLSRAAADHTLAAAALADTHARRGREDERLAQASAAQARFERELELARATVDALAAPLARAEDAASAQAASLRLRLAPGEPCPVCGAKDHPVHGDAGLLAQAEGLRADIAAARSRVSAAQDALAAARSDIGAASAAIGEAAVAGEADERRMQDASSAFALTLSQVRASHAALGLALDLPDDVGDAAAALDEASSVVATAEADVRRAEAAVAAMRRDLVALTGARDTLTAQIEQKEQERVAVTEALAAARVEAERALTTRGNAAERLESSTRELAPILAPTGVTPADIDRDVEATFAVLVGRIGDVQAAAAGLTDADTQLRELEPAAVEAAAQLAEKEAALALARQDLGTRAASLERAVAERALLLDGEPTEAHRTRVEAAHAAAQQAHARASEAAQNAAVAKARAEEAAAGAQQALDKAIGDWSEADEALAEAVAALQIDEASLATRLAVPLAEVAHLRGMVRAADDALLRTQAAVQEREADLAAALAAGSPERPREEAAAFCDAIDARQTERQGRIAAMAGELAMDDAARARLAGFEEELVRMRHAAGVWKAVDAAIGSSSGDKFARFAQGITLDMLVEIANQRLAEFKPRYRLARVPGELALHVIDADMGDEIRSTRSLSGGERFLVSLSLALALSGLGGRRSLAGTLFIDEGFGSLDGESLDLAIDALESLQSQGRMVGVISHVEAMKDRVPVQVRVMRQGGGRSTVSVVAPEGWAA